jgi:hypothetical protein
MTAAIAAPLTAGTVTADGLTFIARSPHPRGVVLRTVCPALAHRLVMQGWAVDIANRPERDAEPCKQCGGEHR